MKKFNLIRSLILMTVISLLTMSLSFAADNKAPAKKIIFYTNAADLKVHVKSQNKENKLIPVNLVENQNYLGRVIKFYTLKLNSSKKDDDLIVSYIGDNTIAPKNKAVLYFGDPMGPNDFSDKPKKDSMGMDYVPVYAD